MKAQGNRTTTTSEREDVYDKEHDASKTNSPGRDSLFGVAGTALAPEEVQRFRAFEAATQSPSGRSPIRSEPSPQATVWPFSQRTSARGPMNKNSAVARSMFALMAVLALAPVGVRAHYVIKSVSSGLVRDVPSFSQAPAARRDM
jgi:hypothetical protein